MKSALQPSLRGAFGRCLADSNRRRRFCRPLTKPLIQGTILDLRLQRYVIFLN